MDNRLSLRDMLTLITMLIVVGSGFYFFGTVKTQIENLAVAVTALTTQLAVQGSVDATQNHDISVLKYRFTEIEKDIERNHPQ